MSQRLVLVAHGQPSDPAGLAQALEALAVRVAGHLPGWQVKAATLAQKGALARGKGRGCLIFPMFMAEGWFTQVFLPKSLREAGFDAPQILRPLGVRAGFHALAGRVIAETGAREVLVAAHGSGRARGPAQVTQTLVTRLQAEVSLARCEAAFIEEAPFLRDAQGWGRDAVCLPFFALEGAHVREDVPEALAQAGFGGRILPPLGLHADVPALIAQVAHSGLEGTI